MGEGQPTPAVRAEQPDSLDGLINYISVTAFRAYASHIGEELTPQLAGELAFDIAELVRPEIAAKIAAEFRKLPVRLAGLGEASDILGVTKQRIHQLWKDNPNFPQLLVKLKSGPVWIESEIEEFKVERESKKHRD